MNAISIIGILTVAVYAAVESRAIAREKRHARVVFGFRRIIGKVMGDVTRRFDEQKLTPREYKKAAALMDVLDAEAGYYDKRGNDGRLSQMRRHAEQDLARYYETRRMLGDILAETQNPVLREAGEEGLRLARSALLSYSPVSVLRIFLGDIGKQITAVTHEESGKLA